MNERPEGSVRTVQQHAGLFPLIVVLGPTASGKSELAVALAKHFGGEILNFDSVQLYRHFDIGTAKTPLSQRRGIPHHLLDVADPDEHVTAGDYARQARQTLGEVRTRERVPVLVGGTGFYLRALLDGLFQGPQRDEYLRERLSSRAIEKPPGYLQRLLTRLDPAAASKIHANDTPKLIRAIEVCLLERTPMSALWRQGRDRLEGYDVMRIGLDPPREALYERIVQRARRMFDAGLVQEIEALLDRGVRRSARPFGSLGHSQALDCIDGRATLEEAIEATAKHSRRYAKRQLTWFRRERDVQWFDDFGDSAQLRSKVIRHLKGRLTPYLRGADW